MTGVRVILLTNAFPYGSWEPFLETEIEYYAPLERVDLFALSVRPDMYERKRKTPENVAVHAIPFKSRLHYLLWGFKSFGRRDFYDELRLLVRSRRFRLRRLVKLMVFMSRASYEAHTIVQILKANGARKSDRRVLYSYRMEYHAYLARLIKQAFPSFAVVLRGHGYDLYEDVDGTHYMPLRRKSFEAADRLVAISEHGAEYLRNRYPQFADRVDLDKLGTVDHGTAPFRPFGGLRILSASSVVPVKRLDRIADALKLTGHLSVHWVHFGGGPLFDHLEEIVSDMPTNVTVELRGLIPHNELMAHMAHNHYDVFINTSDSEGLPVSVMEALSFGIPVLATDVGGTSEIVVEGESGRLIHEPFDPSAIVAALFDFSDASPEMSAALRRSSRNFWVRHHNADSHYPQFIKKLIEVAASGDDLQ